MRVRTETRHERVLRLLRALDAAADVGLDDADFAELALLSIDQAGASVALQDRIRGLLVGAGILEAPARRCECIDEDGEHDPDCEVRS